MTHARPRRLPRAEREAQAVAVARRLFAERGFGAVTMDEVAAEVGVTKPLLYTYFGNKDGLFLAALEPAAQALTATVIAAVQRAESPPEALRAGIHAFFAFVDQDRDSWRVLFDETLPVSGEVAARVATERERITSLIVAALQPQVADHPVARVELQGLSTALLGAAEALARWWLHDGGGISAEQAAELLISTVEPGLRARVGTPSPETT